MRYYEITITDPANPSADPLVFTSWRNNKNDPGALNVQLDVYNVPLAKPQGRGTLAIWGIPIQAINYAANLNFKNIVIKAGFKPGLPLATQASGYSGILAYGFIAQAFGNWQGNEMTLNMNILPGPAPQSSSTSTPTAQQSGQTTPPIDAPTGTILHPANIEFRWPADMPLSQAISNLLKKAFPKYPDPEINISDKWVFNYDQNGGVYNNMAEFSKFIKNFTVQAGASLISPQYSGVDIYLNGNGVFQVYDNANVPKTTNIKFNDIIGQPVWINPAQIQIKCIMRADIQVGQNIILPETTFGVFPSNASLAYPYAKTTLTQKGKFFVVEVHHMGNFRQPDANSWVTTILCAKELT